MKKGINIENLIVELTVSTDETRNHSELVKKTSSAVLEGVIDAVRDAECEEFSYFPSSARMSKEEMDFRKKIKSQDDIRLEGFEGYLDIIRDEITEAYKNLVKLNRSCKSYAKPNNRQCTNNGNQQNRFLSCELNTQNKSLKEVKSNEADLSESQKQQNQSLNSIIRFLENENSFLTDNLDQFCFLLKERKDGRNDEVLLSQLGSFLKDLSTYQKTVKQRLPQLNNLHSRLK